MCEAVEGPPLVSDTAARNAVYKIHVSLGKIVNNLDAAADGAASVAGSGVGVGAGTATGPGSVAGTASEFRRSMSYASAQDRGGGEPDPGSS